MPNDNNDFNSLPKLNNEGEKPVEQPVTQPVQPNPVNNAQNNTPQKPIIEIPQKYYDNLRKEKQQQEELEALDQKSYIENKEANKKLSIIVSSTLFHFALLFICFYLAYNKKDLLVFIFPIIAIIGTVIASIQNKKESTYHTSVLIGGMLAAVVSYVLCILAKEDRADYWMHFSISCAVLSFATFAICALVHNMIANKDNLSALGYIGSVLVIVAIIGVPYYFYHKNPEEIYKAIFMKTTEVKAETLEEFITKTLKNRYGIEFVCDNNKVKSSVQRGRMLKERMCYVADKRELEVKVQSLNYREGDNLYVIIDNYLDVIKLDEFRKSNLKTILTLANAQDGNFFMYPKENCTFIGDCADCKEYYENFEKETGIEHQYKASSSIDYEKYTKMDSLAIVNDIHPKYVIWLVGSYNAETTDFDGIVNKVLDHLNKEKMKNDYGFEIVFYNKIVTDTEVQKKVYAVNGKASDDQVFKNPEVVKLK